MLVGTRVEILYEVADSSLKKSQCVKILYVEIEEISRRVKKPFQDQLISRNSTLITKISLDYTLAKNC